MLHTLKLGVVQHKVDLAYYGALTKPPSVTLLKILLPSAVHLEERLTVSQSVPEPGHQSVRQKHTDKYKQS